MTTLPAYRQRLRAARAGLITSLAAVPDDALERVWPWHNGQSDLRYALLRVADDDQAAGVQIAATLAALDWSPSEARRSLGWAEISQGWLLAELVGVGDALLDVPPAPGEWPLRTALAHVIVTERRYKQRIVWDVAEARAGRSTLDEPPPGVVEPLAAAVHYAAGSLADLAQRLTDARGEALAALADLSATDLAVPSRWATFSVDILFRLHRFAGHERQHAVQIAKTLRGIGFVPTEAQRLLAQAQVTRGQLLAQLVGLPDTLLTRRPAAGTPSVAETLESLITADAGRVDAVRSVLGEG